MMFTDALYLHCDLLNSNIDKRAGDGSMFHLSTAFAKLGSAVENESCGK
jgi:L,D-peptidoglycan transpeptidase YkuD (ErfK/YbiS/YcfS/YnhG family)